MSGLDSTDTPGSTAGTQDEPVLAAIVVHWRNESQLASLLAVWPRDPRFTLVVVDNSASLGPLPTWVRVINPGRNLGFGGGVNRGVAATRAPFLLMLNPDARPEPGALDAVLNAFMRWPDAAGVVPALIGVDGAGQSRWQLRPLPSATALLLQTLRFAGVHGPDTQPAAGTSIEQPAAAALALRRTVFEQVGGFDGRFFPAWFEDVDLAKHLAAGGHLLRYAPDARFVHELGASVSHVGYGRFLWIYYRHLVRYLARHHGTAWSVVGRAGVVIGMTLRALALPVRRPRQAPNRRAAAQGLLATAWGALTGWRAPASWSRDYDAKAVSTSEHDP